MRESIRERKRERKKERKRESEREREGERERGRERERERERAIVLGLNALRTARATVRANFLIHGGKLCKRSHPRDLAVTWP